MEISLKGKTALVCGGSKGIGKAIAFAYASAGAEIILVARDENSLKQTLNELPGKNHEFIAADLNKPANLLEGLQKILSLKTIHILINNSGGPAPGSILDADPEKFNQAFQSHVISSQLLVKQLVPGMKNSKYGRIINIVSTSVKEPIKGLGVSNTIRAAMAGWAKTLSTEVAPFGITVNNILPGYTNTQRLRSLIEQKAKAGGKSIEEMEKEMLEEVPAGRFAEPQELASLALFLASSHGAYITGVSIPMDGGKMKSI